MGWHHDDASSATDSATVGDEDRTLGGEEDRTLGVNTDASLLH